MRLKVFTDLRSEHADMWRDIAKTPRRRGFECCSPKYIGGYLVEGPPTFYLILPSKDDVRTQISRIETALGKRKKLMSDLLPEMERGSIHQFEAMLSKRRSKSRPTGFEPVRHNVSRFLVDRLNHSATAVFF
ncbi:hypothetical protein THAOC_17868, partial [Thalassiosira oceanica]